MSKRDVRESFEKDIATHEMTVMMDTGTVRHVRFKRPNTICMYFDLITWPGRLCYSGDMGTYVFARLEDMFEFFRLETGRKPGKMDLRYWAEKLEAVDKNGPAQEFSKEMMNDVLDDILTGLKDDGDFDAEELASIKKDIDWRLSMCADGEGAARRELEEIKQGGDLLFPELWDYNFQDYTFHFEWCCHAIEWAIGIYDQAQKDKEQQC